MFIPCNFKSDFQRIITMKRFIFLEKYNFLYGRRDERKGKAGRQKCYATVIFNYKSTGILCQHFAN